MTLREPLLLLLFAVLSLSAWTGSNAEETPLADLPVKRCMAGPSPQVQGKIVAVEPLSNDQVVAFCRFPEQFSLFSTTSPCPKSTVSAPVTVPVLAVSAAGSYYCPNMPDGEDGFASIARYSLENGKKTAESKKFNEKVMFLLFSQPMNSIIAGFSTGRISLWDPDLATEKEFVKFPGLYSLSLACDGSVLAVFSPSRLAVLYDLRTGEKLLSFSEGSYAEMVFFDGIKKAVVNQYGSGAKLIALNPYTELFAFPVGTDVRDLAIDVTGTRLFISLIGGAIHVYDLTTSPPALLKQIPTEFSSGAQLTMSPGHIIAWSDVFFELLDSNSHTPQFYAKEPALFDFFAIAPSGKRFFSFRNDRLEHYELQNGTIVPIACQMIVKAGVIDLKTAFYLDEDRVLLVGALSCYFLNPKDMSIKPAFDFPVALYSTVPCPSNDGHLLVTFATDSEIRILDSETGKLARSFMPTTFLEEAVVTNDLRYLAVRSVYVEIVDLAKGEAVFSLRKGLQDLRFSSDGKFLIGFNSDGVVLVSTDTMQITCKIKVPGTISHLVSGENRAIALTNKGVYGVNLRTGALEARWEQKDFEATVVSYKTGLCLFQDTERNIYSLPVNLDN
ncbi:MAG: WD40 repeat domain-containing protein [Candidatus Brocadiia bacterium]